MRKSKLNSKPVQQKTLPEEEELPQEKFNRYQKNKISGKGISQGKFELMPNRPSAHDRHKLLQINDGLRISDRSEMLQMKTENKTDLPDRHKLLDISNDDTEVPNRQKPTASGLPDHLKNGIENLSGLSMDDVKVHYNSDKPALLEALAYTQGRDIHVAPGQERHLPHEAWHVVQQAQGRVIPRIQSKSLQVNDDVLEQEADMMGSKALLEAAGNRDDTGIKENTDSLCGNQAISNMGDLPIQAKKGGKKDGTKQKRRGGKEKTSRAQAIEEELAEMEAIEEDAEREAAEREAEEDAEQEARREAEEEAERQDRIRSRSQQIQEHEEVFDTESLSEDDWSQNPQNFTFRGQQSQQSQKLKHYMVVKNGSTYQLPVKYFSSPYNQRSYGSRSNLPDPFGGNSEGSAPDLKSNILETLNREYQEEAHDELKNPGLVESKKFSSPWGKGTLSLVSSEHELKQEYFGEQFSKSANPSENEMAGTITINCKDIIPSDRDEAIDMVMTQIENAYREFYRENLKSDEHKTGQSEEQNEAAIFDPGNESDILRELVILIAEDVLETNRASDPKL